MHWLTVTYMRSIYGLLLNNRVVILVINYFNLPYIMLNCIVLKMWFFMSPVCCSSPGLSTVHSSRRWPLPSLASGP